MSDLFVFLVEYCKRPEAFLYLMFMIVAIFLTVIIFSCKN